MAASPPPKFATDPSQTRVKVCLAYITWRSNLKLFLLESAVAVLMCKVMQRLFQCVRVVKQVDDHVETVQDTLTVCGELATLRFIDLDTFERLFDLVVLVRQSLHTTITYC